MKATSLLLTCLVGLTVPGVGLAQPVITRQPMDRSVSLGALLTNEVTVSGTPPLTYQWHFNQTPLLSATNRMLILTNLTLTHAGDYFVIVTNASGSVTSRVARLEVDTTFTKITSGLVVTRADAAAPGATTTTTGSLTFTSPTRRPMAEAPPAALTSCSRTTAMAPSLRNGRRRG